MEQRRLGGTGFAPQPSGTKRGLSGWDSPFPPGTLHSKDFFRRARHDDEPVKRMPDAAAGTGLPNLQCEASFGRARALQKEPDLMYCRA